PPTGLHRHVVTAPLGSPAQAPAPRTAIASATRSCTDGANTLCADSGHSLSGNERPGSLLTHAQVRASLRLWCEKVHARFE
ncbi:MAG: hypothetical protein WBX30_04665, partial [Stellaceae bacterium]